VTCRCFAEKADIAKRVVFRPHSHQHSVRIRIGGGSQ
jgi:hypothetical protein